MPLLAALSAKMQRFNVAYNPLATPWLPEPWERGGENHQGYHLGSNTLPTHHSSKSYYSSVKSNGSNNSDLRELLPPRASKRDPQEKVEEIDADWTEVDSDIDSPVDHKYNPRNYRAPVSKLERASNIAANATNNLTATGRSLATATTSIVASAANSAVKTAIQKANEIATAADAARRDVPSSVAETRRDPYDGLRFREPGQLLGHWETQTPKHADKVMEELQEDVEASYSSEMGLRALKMNLSDIVRVETGLSESQESVSTNSRRSRWERRISKPFERIVDEEEFRSETYSSEDSDNSFDSCHEAVGNRGGYIVDKVQRRYQRRQQKMKERKKRATAMATAATPVEQSPIQRRVPTPRRHINSTPNGEVIQLQPERVTVPVRSSCQPWDTAIQPSRPRRPPSPGSSKIAMISWGVDQLPRSNRSREFFEWD